MPAIVPPAFSWGSVVITGLRLHAAANITTAPIPNTSPLMLFLLVAMQKVRLRRGLKEIRSI